jgi:hypothetical protein
LTDVSQVRTASIIVLIMEAIRISETSGNFNVTTARYIPENSKLRLVFFFLIAPFENVWRLE